MHCSCIRGRYDFHVTSYREAIIYQDFSDWIVDEFHSFPESYVVDITLPNSDVTKRLTVGVNHVIRAEDLGLTWIKDGIYCFSVIDCGEEQYEGCCGLSYKRFELIAPFTECCLANGFATLDRYDELKDVEDMLEKAKNSTRLRMIKEARKQFENVQKRLKHINCNC